MSRSAASPTYCRPQHLDRERLRRLLERDDFESVCFHEAVVVAVVETPSAAASASSFQLLAVTSDALVLTPLGSGGASLSRATTTRVRFGDITRVHRVSPAPIQSRRMLLHANSELFEIGVATGPSHICVATFEPSSRAFFYVARGVRLAFQRRIVEGDSPLPRPPLPADDLQILLRDLLTELSVSGDCDERCRLLDELTAAVTSDSVLQRLCFEDQSGIHSGISRGYVTYGLLAFLLQELSLLERDPARADCVVYELSLLQLLQRLLFGGVRVAARLRFFLQTPLETWLRVVTHVPTLATKAQRTDAWHIARDELTNVQAAQVLDLQLLQQEAALLDPTNVQRDALAQALITEGAAFDEWIARVVKRVAVLVSRTPQQLDAAERSCSSGGSHWSLSLWRATKVVRKMLRLSSAQSDARPLAQMLLRRRRDHIDLYLRNARVANALAASSVAHLVEIAQDLGEIVEMLSF